MFKIPTILALQIVLSDVYNFLLLWILFICKHFDCERRWLLYIFLHCVQTNLRSLEFLLPLAVDINNAIGFLARRDCLRVDLLIVCKGLPLGFLPQVPLILHDCLAHRLNLLLLPRNKWHLNEIEESLSAVLDEPVWGFNSWRQRFRYRVWVRRYHFNSCRALSAARDRAIGFWIIHFERWQVCVLQEQSCITTLGALNFAKPFLRRFLLRKIIPTLIVFGFQASLRALQNVIKQPYIWTCAI